MMRRVAPLMLVVAGLVAAPAPAVAQAAGAVAVSRAHLTRAELTTMLTAATGAAASASAAPLREQARREAELIRSRLTAGDLSAGDRVALTVEGEPLLSDTFTVSEGRTLALPGAGELPLAGVLRSELEEHVARHLASLVSDPRVEARVLIALEIRGAVARPGAYALPAETPVADVLAMAGGATLGNAEEDTRIRRDGDVIWEGHALRAAALMGLSLDHLSLGAGDRIEVPGGGDTGEGDGFLRNALVGVGAAIGFVAVLVQAGVF